MTTPGTTIFVVVWAIEIDDNDTKDKMVGICTKIYDLGCGVLLTIKTDMKCVLADAKMLSSMMYCWQLTARTTSLASVGYKDYEPRIRPMQNDL